MTDFYETDRALSEYLLFHYGSAPEILPWPAGPKDALFYPARCVSDCLDRSLLPINARALDLGCAVGRSTFELARYCSEVVGVDSSRKFIEVAEQIRRRGSVQYSYPQEGLLHTQATAIAPPDIDRQRVRFEVGDAQSPRPGLGRFDVVLLANLLDRLPDPRRCLQNLPKLVSNSGQLIITTPCTWIEEFTPTSHWLGGVVRDGQPVSTLQGLHHVLDPDFIPVRTFDLAFLIREHARKYQWGVALATVWIPKTSPEP
jgi:putative 4-mercaptohistidine N1-methyltranferase